MTSRNPSSGNNRRHLLTWLLGALAFLLQACSPQPNETQEPEIFAPSREILALYESCLICHSDKELQRGPHIDGLPAWYVSHQLEKFASGARGQSTDNKSEQLMGSTHSLYQDPEIRSQLALHIESLPLRSRKSVVKGDAVRGAQLYNLCSACHGLKAEGNQKQMAPPLNIQDDWYLLEQMRKFKSQLRGYHPDDYTGINMYVMIQQVQKDEDLRNIVAYLQTLSLSREKK